MLDALKASDSTDVIRQALQVMLQQPINAEATTCIGAESHERSDERTNLRNGTRSKTITTAAGHLDLSITKLCTGSFFRPLLERRRRIDRALLAAIMARAPEWSHPQVLGCPADSHQAGKYPDDVIGGAGRLTRMARASRLCSSTTSLIVRTPGPLCGLGTLDPLAVHPGPHLGGVAAQQPAGHPPPTEDAARRSDVAHRRLLVRSGPPRQPVG